MSDGEAQGQTQSILVLNPVNHGRKIMSAMRELCSNNKKANWWNNHLDGPTETDGKDSGGAPS